MEIKTSPRPISSEISSVSLPYPSPVITTQGGKLIPDNVQIYLKFSLYLVGAGGLGMMGVVANIINVIVFGKQGMQDSASMCLVALSLTDLGVCLSTLLGGVCTSVDELLDDRNDLPIDVGDIYYLFASWPRVYFAQLSMCTTVVLSLERCMCVIRPLTYKRFINRGTTFVLLAILYCDVFGVAAALFAMHDLAWQFNDATNTSQLKLAIQEGPVPLKIFQHHSINNYVLTSISMAVVIVCTVVMATRLVSLGKFRQASTSVSRDHTMANRDTRLVKLVTLISAIFLLCYVPLMVVTAVSMGIRKIDRSGQWPNLNNTLWGLVWLIGALNSSVNIFVYYKTSSKYKQVFLETFMSYPTKQNQWSKSKSLTLTVA